MPRAARNQMLSSAGLAPAYAGRALSDEDMAPVKDAVAWMLERHAPFPAFVVDRHWVLQQMNRPAAMMLGVGGLSTGDSMIDALIGNPALRGAIVNLEEITAHAIARLRTESTHLGGDPVLDRAIVALTESMAGLPGIEGLFPAVIPTRYRVGEIELALFSTITQFGSAEDLALSELKIEMMFPADAPTREVLMNMADG